MGFLILNSSFLVVAQQAKSSDFSLEGREKASAIKRRCFHHLRNLACITYIITVVLKTSRLEALNEKEGTQTHFWAEEMIMEKDLEVKKKKWKFQKESRAAGLETPSGQVAWNLSHKASGSCSSILLELSL